VLTLTVVASLLSPMGRVRSAVGVAERRARAYLAVEYHADPEEREAAYQAMCEQQQKLRGLNPTLVKRAVDDSDVHYLLDKAHQVHLEATGA